ncbi:MAG: sensor histidine kinase [Holophagaceae bacterium]|nr:sensor histidine kinase [Holophagaceae bacterium]
MSGLLRSLGFLLLGLSLWAAPPVELGQHDRLPLAGHMEVLMGAPAGTLEQALQAAAEGRFVPLAGNVTKGYGKDPMWVRFTLRLSGKQRPISWLEVKPSYLREVSLFTPRPDGGYEAAIAGAGLPFAVRQIPYLAPVFRLEAPAQPGTEATYYLRAETPGARVLRPILWDPATFQQAVSTEALLYGLFYGVGLIILVTNLIYLIKLREPIHFYYAAYVAAMLLMFATLNGHAERYLFPGSDLSIRWGVPLSVVVQPWLAVYIFSVLTDFGSAFPRLDRAYRAVGVGLTAVFLFATALGGYYRVAPLTQLALLVIIVANLAGALVMSLRRNRTAMFYLLAFSPQLIGGLFRVASNLSMHNADFLAEYGMHLGAMVHLVLMSLPLADRMGRIKEERDAAQRETLETIARHQVELEGQVEARTRELREEQARTAEALQRERQVVAEQRQFLSLVSHEFRTPLAVMDGAAQMARLSVDAPPADLLRSTQSIQQGVGSLLHLLDTWLTTDRIASGLRALQPEPVVLPALLTEVVKRAADTSRRDLRADLDDLPKTTLCDRDLLGAALLNLLDNAFKYSPAGSPVHLRAQAQDGWLQLEVQDQGQGIPADQLPQLTTRYFRGRNVGQIPGMGLGLHLVRTIAELHGGRLELESTEGQGTTARLVLPVGDSLPD